MTVIQFPKARIVREQPIAIGQVQPEPTEWLREVYDPPECTASWFDDWLRKWYSRAEFPPTYPRRR